MATLTIKSELCKGCELCVNACPKSLLSIDGDSINSIGYNTACIKEQDKCTGCAMCARMCPEAIITVTR